MVNLRKFLKPYRDAGASNAVLAPHRFIDERVFLTKSNQLGIVLTAQGVDYECLTDETLESYAKRAAQAWRAFDHRFRLYQRVVKQGRALIEYAGNYDVETVRKTVADRNGYLRSRARGLYTLRLVYVLLFEPPTLRENAGLKRAISTPKGCAFSQMTWKITAVR